MKPARPGDLATTVSTVFQQGFALGGTRFRRLEGCWEAHRRIFFVSTNGGNMGFGQVFLYDPTSETLSLIAESPSHEVFDGPDNLYGRSTVRTTTPYRSPVQIPVGPERFERAATLAIWGPWASGLV